MDNPKARIDLRRDWVGCVGGNQAESASGVHRNMVAISIAGLVIIHLKNLAAVSCRW